MLVGRWVRFCIICLLLSLTTMPAVVAEVSLTFPVDGYRSGCYLPVIAAGDAGSETRTLVVSTDGAVPVHAEVRGQFSIELPLLVCRAPLGDIRWQLDDASGSVSPQLIEYRGDSPLVHTPASSTLSRLGAMRYDAVDRVLVSPGHPWLADQRFRRALASHGCVMDASGGDAAGVSLAGPIDGVIVPRAFEPIGDWRPGRLRYERWMSLAIAVGFGVLCLSAALPRWRWGLPVILGLCVLITTAIALLLRPPPGDLHTALGAVTAGPVHTLGNKPLEQVDVWRMVSPKRPGRGSVRMTGNIRPMLYDDDHAERLKLRLDVDEAGAMAFSFDLPERGRMIFLQRIVRELPATAPTSGEGKYAIGELAKRLYAGKQWKIDGWRSAGDDNEWGVIRLAPAD